jgi:hypothetical protein
VKAGIQLLKSPLLPLYERGTSVNKKDDDLHEKMLSSPFVKGDERRILGKGKRRDLDTCR